MKNNLMKAKGKDLRQTKEMALRQNTIIYLMRHGCDRDKVLEAMGINNEQFTLAFRNIGMTYQKVVPIVHRVNMGMMRDLNLTGRAKYFEMLTDSREVI